MNRPNAAGEGEHAWRARGRPPHVDAHAGPGPVGVSSTSRPRARAAASTPSSAVNVPGG